ncbi:MAG: SRPBCC family protein [Chloroflexota bacterium]|jgi:carbon monoxide dehydrogenase subunit G
MTVMKLEREVAAPAAKVWAICTDLDRTVEVISAISALERTDGGSGFGVGTAWRETRVMFGRETTESMAVTGIDEGRSYVVESTSRGVRYKTVVLVEPTGDDRCRLVWEFGAEPLTTGARLMSVVGRLFEGSTRKAIKQDLDDIAAAAEASD